MRTELPRGWTEEPYDPKDEAPEGTEKDCDGDGERAE